MACQPPFRWGTVKNINPLAPEAVWYWQVGNGLEGDGSLDCTLAGGGGIRNLSGGILLEFDGITSGYDL